MKNRQTEQQPITALYERLSRDDEVSGDSVSIQMQKQILRDYANAHGFCHCVDYADDGWSGGNFNRPSWQAMIADIEAGKVSTVIVKDMSRVGRNYLQTGYYTEVYFPQNNVRFIAISNNIDSNDNTSSEFAPFLNIMNEWYLRDQSRKQKQAYQARVKSGTPSTNHVIYGYRKDPENKHHWLVDEEAAEVVRKIFRLAASGLGVRHIADELQKEHVERPASYMRRKGYEQYNRESVTRPFDWNATTVSTILKREEYLGHSVSFRRTNISYKSKKQKENDPSEWIIQENTHEPIIDRELFDQAQRCRKTVRRSDDGGKPNVLTGLVFCADCGKKMYNHRKKGKKKPITERYQSDIYSCSTYDISRYYSNSNCTAHTIPTKALRGLIKEAIHSVTVFAMKDKDAFTRKIRTQAKLKHAAEAKNLQKKVAKAKHRIEDLDRLQMKLYEDYALERISYERYREYNGKYEAEQTMLKSELELAESQLNAFADDTDRIERFYELANRFTNYSELTDEMILAFVDKILVHEPNWVDGQRLQDVEIYLKHIGKVELDSMPALPPTAEDPITAEKRKQKRDYNKQYYLQKTKPKLETAKAAVAKAI